MIAMPRTNPLTDEEGRLEKLLHLEALSHSDETSFQLITSTLTLVFGLDSAAVSLIDKDLQHLRARKNIPFGESPRRHAFCNVTIQSYELLVVEDATADPRFRDNPYVTGPPHLRCYAGAPLITEEGYALGALCVMGTEPRRFSKQELAILERLAELVVEQLALRTRADRDSLTGAYTRRRFTEDFRREIERVRRGGPVSALAALDLDDFKQVNDTFGHPAGDRVLVEFADLVRQESRSVDIIARVGGEEFMVLLPATDVDAARRWAERLRRLVAGTSFAGPDAIRVTTSIGLVGLLPGAGSAEALYEEADRALYQAKDGGRNQVVVL